MEIPSYFQKYMDEKFDTLHEKIDAVIHEHDKDIMTMKNDLSETREDVKWLNQKVWGAMGIASIVIIIGGVLASSFKALNKAQIQEAVTPLHSDVDKIQYDIDNIKKDVSSTRETLKNYDFIVNNN